MGPCYLQSLSEDVAVTFGEYCESFAAHQVTLLSWSMVGTCQTPPPSPPLSSSLPPPPAQLLGSSQRSWTDRCHWVPQRLGPEQAVSPSTPGWGKLNRTRVKKSLQREKEPCAAHLPDKRFNQPALRHPSPSSSPWDELKSATTITWWKYPLTKRDGSSQRGWTVIEFDAVLITTHVRRPCGVLVAGTACSHLLPSKLEDIYETEISRPG